MELLLASLLVVKMAIMPVTTAAPVAYDAQHAPSEQRATREYEQMVLNTVVISSGKHSSYSHFIGIDPNHQQLSVQISF